ncbi:MAG: hypothetical protein ACOYU0_01945 [Nitrospirota bacterium]
MRYISNFTDFDPFMYEPDVELIYSLWDGDIENADLLIIPGSKNTVKDLLSLRVNGIEESIKRAVGKGILLIGICGGYQMLGGKIYDPFNVESIHKEVEGFGLLDIETTIQNTKITSQVEASVIPHRFPFAVTDNGHESRLKGYEIHMGETTGDIGLFSLSRLTPYDSRLTVIMDGSVKGNVWGTYIHGIFDNDRFRRSLINSLRVKKGLKPTEATVDYSKLRDNGINRWAKILKESIDLAFIERLIRI